MTQDRRTIPQNREMWRLLHLCESINWHGHMLTSAEWKDVFTASLKRQKVVPGIDGGFVVIGAHTSTMSKQELADLIDLIAAFLTSKGIYPND